MGGDQSINIKKTSPYMESSETQGSYYLGEETSQASQSSLQQIIFTG